MALLLLLLLLCAAGGRSSAQRDIPPYERGSGKYQWITTELERERGISYFGAAERLRAKMKDVSDGKPVKIVAIGGSITAGQGCVDAPSWSEYMINYLQDNNGGKSNVSLHLAAVGGTMSTYMEVCHNLHVPRDASIIFVDYTINDPSVPSQHHHFKNDCRQSFERLLRKLLQYPNKPAVVLIHAFTWSDGLYWDPVEREFGEFALFYGIPEISVKGAAYHLMATGVNGFRVDATRNKDEEGLKNHVFYYDDFHPDGRTGARVMGELAIHILLKAMRSLKERPFSPEEAQAAVAPLPRPMVPGNEASVGDKCFIGTYFKDTVLEKGGDWEWVNESKGNRPKWGMISRTPGAVMKIKIDTRAPSVKGDALVEMAYLKSYEHMGRASIKCEAGCSCNDTSIDGHNTEHNSQLHLHTFHVSQHEACIIAVTVLPDTFSGEHKVKIAGIMVTEQHGDDGVRNAAAVEYVHDISARGSDGVYSVYNHARRLRRRAMMGTTQEEGLNAHQSYF